MLRSFEFTVQMDASERDHAKEVAAGSTSLSDVSAKLAALEAEHAAAQQALSERDMHQASAIAALQGQLHDTHEKLSRAESAVAASHQDLADANAALAAAKDESAALRLEAEGLRSTLHTQDDELQQQAAQADTWESECLGEASQAGPQGEGWRVGWPGIL